MEDWNIKIKDSLPGIILKPGKEHSVLNRHPWIFRNAIQKQDDSIAPGETVDIFSASGQWLARGAFSPNSQIRVRIYTWEYETRIDQPFFEQVIQRIFQAKKRLFIPNQVNAYRLIYAESDGIPGFIADVYQDILVVQFLSWACEYWRQDLLEILISIIKPISIFERSDSDTRQLEGLDNRIGKLWGEDVDNPLLIQENGISYWVDLIHGHKTGFYLDQRDNRVHVKEYAQDRNILDCFCYTGGMAIPCLINRAKTIEAIDSSSEALKLFHENLLINQIPEEKANLIQGDVFSELRKRRDKVSKYDMVILDPPKFAPTVSFVHKATRAYKDINLVALKLLNPNGILVTFSCSGGVSLDLFQKIIYSAALDAKREVKILETLHQARDHGIALNFPESAYLKGFILEVN